MNTPRRLADVQHSIRDGNLLLFRRRGLISIAGRGVHTHAAKAAWWPGHGGQPGVLFCLEVRQWVGGRAVTLESQVEKFPGRIDVFEANPDDKWPYYDAAASTRYMKELCGRPYGYRAIVMAALLHLPVVRCFVNPEIDDLAVANRPPFCSQACCLADRVAGGVDPVPHLADRLTEPADLARSPFYRFAFTLVP